MDKNNKKIVYNYIVLKNKSNNRNDIYYLYHNGKEIISAPCILFAELCLKLLCNVVIKKDDLLISSHDCELVHYDLGFAGIYIKKILFLQKDKETKFDIADDHILKVRSTDDDKIKNLTSAST